jgi:hypothetical protein
MNLSLLSFQNTEEGEEKPVMIRVMREMAGGLY